MPLTLITRETFQGVGTLNAGTPGNLGTVSTGSFQKRPYGPKLTGDSTAAGKGWSADMRTVMGISSSTTHQFTVTATAAATRGFFSAFYYFDSWANNGVNKTYIARVDIVNTNHLIQVLIDGATGNFLYAPANVFGNDVNTNIAVPVRSWFELRVAWENTSAQNYRIHAMFRLAGSTTWTTLFLADTPINANSLVANAKGGAPSFGNSAGTYRGRYGMPQLQGMGQWTERFDALPDVIDPTSPHLAQWFVDPVNGSDANDGVTESSAWRTVAKINDESRFCGMFPQGSYSLGNTLTIDTRTANLLLGTLSLRVFTAGLNVIQLGGGRTGTGELQAWTTMGPVWTQYDAANFPNIWQQTLSESNPNIVLWENDLWLNHPIGAAITNVRAALNTTPGSFWTDGTTMYLVPFGNTNPNTGGKVYTRSYNRGNGQSAVEMLAPHFNMESLRVVKTCLALPNALGAILGYCFQSNSAAGGNSRMRNCYGAYGDKHVFGFTDNAADRRYHIIDCQAEQGSPYAGVGGQTPWVDYSSFAVVMDNQTLYEGCVTLQPTGLIGSTVGQSAHDAFICHNNGTANTNFSLISFVSCEISGSLDAGGAILNCVIENSTISGIVYRGKGVCSVDRSKATRTGFYNNSTGSLIARNSLIVPDRSASTNAEYQVSGTASYLSCTFDLSKITILANATGMFRRNGALNLTFRDCVWMTGSYNYTVLENATSTDTLTFDHNAYQLGSASKVVTNYNDGTTTADRTFAQWQALGKDADSFTTADPKLSAGYYPLGGSPLIGAGTDRGQVLDYSGKTVRRVSIGALEMILAGGSRLAVARSSISATCRSTCR